MKKRKVAVVTGGSRGIGFEIVRKLIDLNWNVAICSRTKKELNDAVRKFGENCFGVVCDVSDFSEVRRFSKLVEKKFGEVDVLINNAGVIVWKDFSEQSSEEISKQVEVNLTGLMFVTLNFLRFISKNGMIVNVSSMAGKRAHPGMTPYCATKFGVRGFTQSLALERKDLKVYSVNPSTTATEMTDFEGVPAEKVAELVLELIVGNLRISNGGDLDVNDYF